MALEDLIRGNDELYAKFVKVRTFVDGILAGNVPQELQVLQTPDDFYTDHGPRHLRRVTDKLHDFVTHLAENVDDEECFLLLVAAYCHDLGMFLGREQGEPASETRNHHHERSAAILRRLVEGRFIDLLPFELSTVEDIVRGHRLVDLATLQEVQHLSGHSIRTRLLAALLRLADACDIDHSRAPEAVFAFYQEIIPPVSREHWRRHQIVSDVYYEPGRASIVVSVDLTGGFVEGFEKAVMAHVVLGQLKREVDSASETLSSYGISVVRVEVKDYNRGTYVGFSEFPQPSNYVLIGVVSSFRLFQEFYQAVEPFLAENQGPVLLIEIRPPEGPLFIDTHRPVLADRLDDLERSVKDRLGIAFVHLIQSVTPAAVRVS